MATPKKIIIKDLELADEEIARLRKEHKKLMKNGILTQKERDKNGMDLIALQIENKVLRECNKNQSEVINNVFIPQKERLEEKNKELKEKIDTLELCIKNKDELLEEYRKKLDKLRTDNIYEEGLYD